MIATPLIICLSVWSQAAPDAGWLVGEPFDRQLASVTSVLFESAPLGERLETLSRVHRLYVWLDRRVDPSRVVDFQLQGRTVEQTLRQLAATLDLGVCVVGNVVYLGPAETAARLGSWSAHWETERKRLPAAWAQTLGKRSKLSWPLLSTPREVLESVAQQAGMKWEQLEQIPHDLMRATELPELSLAEQLMLLLSGFDRTFRCSADGALSPLPLPEPTEVTRVYSVASSQRVGFEAVLQRHQDATVARQGSRVRVTGGSELHRELSAALRTPPSRPGETRYTLAIKEQPFAGVAQQLAAKLGLEIEFVAGIEQQLDQRISFSVEEVSRDELLQKMAAAAGLRAEVRDGYVRIAK